jgi:CIC family chloride channel protein
VPAGTKLSAFRQDHPLAAVQRVILVDAEQRYAGIAYPADVFTVTGESRSMADIATHGGEFLTPEMNVKAALALFETGVADALAVLDDAISRKVVGLLTEAYALKRYNEELDRQRRELAGE